MHSMPLRFVVYTVFAALGLCSCASLGQSSETNPVPRASNVDIARYAGPWYIIAAIPLPIVEKGAFNPVETYTQNPDGSIATVFQYRQDSFDGKLETKSIIATVDPGTRNAEWRVQTIWPLKQQYVIAYLEPDYSAAIVARDARDHVWILSRSPRLGDNKLAEYRGKIAAMGYDIGKLMVFPQNGSKPSS